jgi:glycosyltransferase involved in cell wall biosynthesis
MLANEIVKLLNNKNKINKMGSNSRNYALKNFDIKRIVDKHIKLYREILKK